MEEVMMTLATELCKLIISVAGVVVSAIFIPWLVKTGIPWLKEKRLYATVERFVRAAEKLGDAGTIEKGTKKQYVISMLEKKGITVTPEVDAFIEAAVQELDVLTKDALAEIGEVITAEAGDTEN